MVPDSSFLPFPRGVVCLVHPLLSHLTFSLTFSRRLPPLSLYTSHHKQHEGPSFLDSVKIIIIYVLLSKRS